MMKVSIKNLPAFRESIEVTKNNIYTLLDRGGIFVRTEVVNHAKSNHGGQDISRYKDQTGDLTNSIGVNEGYPEVERRAASLLITIMVGMDYAEIVEERKPYMRPAVEANLRLIMETFDNCISEGLKIA